MLRGKRIALCPLGKDDFPILFNWINEREQVIFNSPYKPVHQDCHEKWRQKIVESNDTAIFGIRRLDDGSLVGTCQLHGIHPVHRSAELQIRIGETNERGQGFGFEAVSLLLRFAFDDLNLQRVYLHVFKDNLRAVKLYEKTGFKIEGTLRRAAFIGGAHKDILIMGLLEEEYSKQEITAKKGE